MAAITITIPDALLPRVVDGMAASHNWTAADGTKAAFAKKVLIRYIVANVRSAEQEAADAANPRPVITDIDGLT